MSDNLVIKEFNKKDVFYNNGLVNLKIYLDEYNVEGLMCELNSNSLILKYPQGKDEKYYSELFKGFIVNNQIVFHTDNDRLYWNKNNNCFIYGKKYDVQGKASGNDVKNLYKYITPSELEMNTEEVFNKYMDFAKKSGLKEANIKEDTKIFKKDSSFKKENQCKIPILMTPSEAVESYIEYSVKGDLLNVDSKIHQFEDGGYCFRDMLLNKDNYVDKWDALIYWYGVKMKRYYNSIYFIYLNSADLCALYEMKKHLIIEDNAVEIKDEKSGIVKATSTNVRLTHQLKYDGIENNNFYISNSISEFQLKFFMYMLSHIYHIEDDYENADEKRVRKRIEKLYNSLSKISFVAYTEDGNMKSSLDEYTKAYKVIMFFKKLVETEYLDSTLFKYFADLITAIVLSNKNDQEKKSKKVNLNIKKFCENILKFSDLRKIYYEVSFKILKNNKANLGSGLYNFENVYLQETKRGEYIMDLHAMAKEMGNGIGVYASNLGNNGDKGKDLLFKLRNIKNKRQIIAYFKDLEFTILRNQDEAKFAKQVNENIEKVLEAIEERLENWEIIRDYMAVYAIDKYRASVYAKQASKGGK